MNRLYRLMDIIEGFDRRHPAVGQAIQRMLSLALLGAASYLIVSLTLDPTKPVSSRVAGLYIALYVVTRVAVNDARQKERKR